MMMRLALLVGAMATAVNAHGAVTIPKPRQAVDGTLAPWNGSVPQYPIPFDSPNWCESPSHAAQTKDPRHLTGSNGQACFWFNSKRNEDEQPVCILHLVAFR